MIRAGIIGGAGYTAGELLRILQYHPRVEIEFVQSSSQAGESVTGIHRDLAEMQHVKFVDQPSGEVEVLFLCSGHGRSAEFLRTNDLPASTRVVDLSHDFRLKGTQVNDAKSFVYGLPELNKDDIRSAMRVANPGCFATAIQLALLPLASEGMLTDAVNIHAVTGSTGAGFSPSETTHFSWRDNNFSYYKPFVHQHLGEIRQSLEQLQKKTLPPIYFLPHRGNFSRGIFATAYTPFDGSIEDAFDLYKDFYQNDPFTYVSEQEIHLKQVVNTNNAVLHLHKHEGQLLVASAIDNLIKGASGQAVQNMNLMFGYEEEQGLQLKATYF